MVGINTLKAHCECTSGCNGGCKYFLTLCWNCYCIILDLNDESILKLIYNYYKVNFTIIKL